MGGYDRLGDFLKSPSDFCNQMQAAIGFRCMCIIYQKYQEIDPTQEIINSFCQLLSYTVKWVYI